MKPFRYGCIVSGENFCPRPELENQLREYARSGQNVVIHGARRMGKTSLVQHAIGKMRKMRLVYADLYGVRTVADVCSRVMKGVAKASGEESFLRKALQLAFRLRPVISLDPVDGSPTISVDARAASEPDSLGAVMTMLEKISAGGGTCIVFDEYQDMLKLDNSRGVLAEMRSTIQFQSDTPYFFTGSVRNDMMSIFDHPDSPFFKSALPVSIEEIDPIAFSKFIAARFAKGDRKIAEPVVARIIDFADGVPGDVQELCDALWETTEPGGTIADERFPAALELVFSRERGGYEAIVERLTPGQSAILAALADRGGKNIYSNDFAARTGTPPSSIRRIVNRLVADRLVFLHGGEYRFSNPFFKAWIRRNFA